MKTFRLSLGRLQYSDLVDGLVGLHRTDNEIGAGDNQGTTHEVAPARNGNTQQAYHRHPENDIGDNHGNDTAAALVDIAFEHRQHIGRNKEHRGTENS